MRIIATLLLAATLISCKEYTCHCTFHGAYATSGVTRLYKESSKKKATARCEDEEASHIAKGDSTSCGLE